MKRTKIVCTIGPASEKPSALVSMMKAGMDVARLNFSHSTHTAHKKLIRAVRSAAKKANKHVPIIGDLQGPKIRLGELPEEGVNVKAGESVIFSTAVNKYKNKVFPVTYKKLHKDVKAGNTFLMDDGLFEAKIKKVVGKQIHAKMITGGILKSHKGMNFPHTSLKVSAITKKDIVDTKFGVEQGVDWIALSFVTDKKDVLKLRRLIKKYAKKGQILPRIIVKIEKHEAIDHFDEILKVVDGVMVARGDLGIEIPAEEVPVRQKEIIEKCRQAGKPVIVATQMLDSMIRNPRPTRAEVSDVANAVFDHTDAVMLSGESATGKYPLKAVEIMTKIAEESEESPYDDVFAGLVEISPEAAVGQAIKLFSLSGQIDGIIASHAIAPWSEGLLRSRAETRLFLACENETTARQNAIQWGVTPFIQKKQNPKTFLKRAIVKLKKEKLIKKGSRLVVVIGAEHGKGADIITV